MRLLPPFLVLAIGGCTPHDGEVTGSYVAYLSQGSSLTIQEIEEARRIDLGEQSNLDRLGLAPIDCRDLAEDDEDLRLPLTDPSSECDGAPEWFSWFEFYPYYVKQEPLDPWRVEVVLTGEHDLQLTAHHDVPRFGDFRFGWVIDPFFGPTECRDAEGGGSELVEVDGDWVDRWSDDVESGTMYYLNAGAYQTHPDIHKADTGDSLNPDTSLDDYLWFLEQDWLGGYTFGRYDSDELFGHPTDYTHEFNPAYYYGFPLYFYKYCDGGGCDPGLTRDLSSLPRAGNKYENWVEDMREFFGHGLSDTYADLGDDAGAALADLGTFGKTDEFPLSMHVEDNGWRIDDADQEEVEYEATPDGAAGLENWIGINASWVRFDATREELQALEPGSLDTPLTGEFQVQLDGLASATRVFVRGSFSIDRIRKDSWGYSPTLEEIKREENNTPDCGEDYLTDDVE